MESNLPLTHRYDTSSYLEANWRLNRELMTATTQLSVHCWKKELKLHSPTAIPWISICQQSPSRGAITANYPPTLGVRHTHTKPTHIAHQLKISNRQKIDVCPDFILSSCMECSTVVIELRVVGTKIRFSSSVCEFAYLCVSRDSTPDIMCHGFGWVLRKTQMVFQGLYGGLQKNVITWFKWGLCSWGCLSSEVIMYCNLWEVMEEEQAIDECVCERGENCQALRKCCISLCYLDLDNILQSERLAACLYS